MREWLLIDANYLVHRAFHSTGQLSFNGKPTGIAFGVFRDIDDLRGRFGTELFVFAFDSQHSERRKACPTYKKSRQAHDGDFNRQIEDLQCHLKSMGYRNVIVRAGWEADDILADLCKSLSSKERAIIVSADNDLLQLLSPNVKIWKPQKKEFYTLKKFQGNFGITPDAWPTVKAYAGCSTDEVDGIEDVGEKTVCRFLTGQLSKTSKAYQKIISPEGTAIRDRNLPLVTLPYPGMPEIELQRDCVTDAKWNRVMERLGMRSLVRPI